jgi:hypothetical protein
VLIRETYVVIKVVYFGVKCEKAASVEAAFSLRYLKTGGYSFMI